MSHTKDLSFYGPEYREITLRAYAMRPEPFRIKLATHGLATSLRGKIYAYWRAMQEDAHDAMMLQAIEELSVRVEDRECVVFGRIYSDHAVAMREALGASVAQLYPEQMTDVERLDKLRAAQALEAVKKK